MDKKMRVDPSNTALMLGITRRLGLPNPNLVVKDIAVVRALAALQGAALDGARLVFSGGTALARAHRLVDRMSEDIDLKVVLPDFDGMSKSAVRKSLSRVKDAAREAIVQAGFSIGPENVRSRNDNRYIAFKIPYATNGAAEARSTVLDPHIQLELVCKVPRLPTIYRPLATLACQALDQDPEVSAIECISLPETAAEKLVSLTRRVAAMLEAARPDAPFDRRLVRHIYDLHAMRDAIDTGDVLRLAREVSVTDAAEFRNQNPGYAADPVGWTIRAVDDIRNNPMHRSNYEAFVNEMVYGKIPDFDEACEPLSALTDALWPSDAKLWVPPFPVATHALSNADGNVRVVDRKSGRADNPNGPAVVLIDGTAEWYLDGDRVAQPADEQDDSQVAGLRI